MIPETGLLIRYKKKGVLFREYTFLLCFLSVCFRRLSFGMIRFVMGI